MRKTRITLNKMVKNIFLTITSHKYLFIYYYRYRIPTLVYKL